MRAVCACAAELHVAVEGRADPNPLETNLVELQGHDALESDIIGASLDG